MLPSGPQESALIWAPLPPLPNRRAGTALPFPGVFIGSWGGLETTGNDLSQLIVVPYLMNAESLEARGLGAAVTGGKDESCEELFEADGGGALAANVDYWKLPSIPAETLLRGKSYALVVTGCVGDSTTNHYNCPYDFLPGAPGLGTLTLTLTAIELDNGTMVEPTTFGVQVVHASLGADKII